MMRSTKVLQLFLALVAVCGGLATADEREGKKKQRGSKSAASELVQRAEGSPAMMEQVFGRMDVNGDGRIDQDEFLAPVLQRFQRADGNGDGSIDREEMIAAREQIAGLMRGGPFMIPGNRPMQRDEANEPNNSSGEKRQPEDRIRELMQKVQLDENGSIRIDDVPDPMRARLTRLDKNNDGLIDSSEGGELLTRIQKARKQRGQKSEGDQKSKGSSGTEKEEKGRRGNDRQGPQKPKRPADESRD